MRKHCDLATTEALWEEVADDSQGVATWLA